MAVAMEQLLPTVGDATTITGDSIEGCPNPDDSHEFSVF
jgi:hypothetical protein